VLVICLLVVILDNTILNVALKTIQGDLGASQSEMQWAVDSYALVFAGLLIPAGVLGDRLGRRGVLLFGMLAFGATSALCSFADSPTTLILFRALMGIGAAAVQPQTLSIIQNVFEPHERGKAIGIWAGASGMAIALGPIAGGALLKYFWWGSIFLVNVPIVIVGLVLIWWLVPTSRDPRPGRLDPVGALLSVAALVILVFGVIEGGNSNHWLRWNTLGAILLGVALLGVFVRVQSRSDHPTIDVSLFKNRHFSAGSAAISATFFTLLGATFYLAYFMQAIRGYTPLAAGVALIAVAAAVMLASPLSSRLSARFGPRLVTGCGLTLFAFAIGSYALARQGMPQWVIEVQMFCMGTGMGLTMGPATMSIMSAVPREKAGAGSAVNNTVRQVAGALGVAILGSILSVVFRAHLGEDRTAQVASTLHLPPAIVHVDDTQSIGNAYEFVARVKQAAPPHVPPSAEAQQELAAFMSDAKGSFMSAMHITSLFAALAGLSGAFAAFRFFPSRREFAAHTAHPGAPPVPAEVG
jgi:DHA2 family integral membrane protein (MFS transporter)